VIPGIETGSSRPSTFAQLSLIGWTMCHNHKANNQLWIGIGVFCIVCKLIAAIPALLVIIFVVLSVRYAWGRLTGNG